MSQNIKAKTPMKPFSKKTGLMARWLPAIVLMTVIFLLSSVPGKVINEVGLGKETYHINGHFLLFLLLTFTYFKAMKNIPAAILLTILFAVFDELHQMLTPLRSASLFDIFVDTIGAIIAGGFLWKLQFILPKKLRDWLAN